MTLVTRKWTRHSRDPESSSGPRWGVAGVGFNPHDEPRVSCRTPGRGRDRGVSAGSTQRLGVGFRRVETVPLTFKDESSKQTLLKL